MKLLEWQPYDEVIEGEYLLDELPEWDVGEPAFQLLSSELDTDPQLTFPVETEFSPSKELLDLWITSVRSYAADPELAKSIPAFSPSEIDLRQEFARTLHAALGVIAQQLRYDGSTDLHVTLNGRFTPKLQLEICEQFLVGAYEASAFLTMLGNELTSLSPMAQKSKAVGVACRAIPRGNSFTH